MPYSRAKKSIKVSASRSQSPGGHSSRPVNDNAIYRLAEGLTRLSKYQFPAQVNEVTAEYYKRMALLDQRSDRQRYECRFEESARIAPR